MKTVGNNKLLGSISRCFSQRDENKLSILLSVSISARALPLASLRKRREQFRRRKVRMEERKK